MSCAPTISFSKAKAFSEGSLIPSTRSNGSANIFRCRGDRYLSHTSSATSPESAICTASGNHCLPTSSGGAECQKLVFAQIDNAVSEREKSETTLLVNPIRSYKKCDSASRFYERNNHESKTGTILSRTISQKGSGDYSDRPTRCPTAPVISMARAPPIITLMTARPRGASESQAEV